ncbi:MAG: SDR family oxidoreductase [Chloroflexi bacterium]|nr:SDR family oxidoreductase [Chloroflexota bacterium]
MYLLIGATSKLGTRVARRLLAEGKPVRAMTRTPDKATELKKLGAEIVPGDLRDPGSLARACAGVEKILDAAHGFPGEADNNPQTVDDAGKRALIDAAKRAGVQHFVFTSALGVSPQHPIDFFRIKFATEEYLRASGMSFTILRPGAFMEFWAALVGEPIVKTGKTTIFGRGDNPINFVSADDVARYALIALDDPRARDQVIEIGGPENLTLNQVAAVFEKIAGRSAQKSHVPLPMMRVLSFVSRPFNPALSRQVAAGINMDTADWTFDPRATQKKFPVPLTKLEEYARTRYA